MDPTQNQQGADTSADGAMPGMQPVGGADPGAGAMPPEPKPEDVGMSDEASAAMPEAPATPAMPAEPAAPAADDGAAAPSDPSAGMPGAAPQQ